jgi:sterol 3beta-glucosyltransferase
VKITLLTAGTRGDTQPYVALGVALRAAGHTATVAAPAEFEQWIRSHGLAFAATDGASPDIMSSAVVQQAMRADNPVKVLLSFHKLKKLVIGMQAQLYDACVGAELIVFHPGAVIGAQAARQMGIPAVLATPFPMSATAAYPALVFYRGRRWGARLNRLSHRLFQQIMAVASGSPVKSFWKTRFGVAPPIAGNPFRAAASRRNPTLVGVSRHVFAEPEDWPAHTHGTGYWFLDTPPGWQAPPQLNAFLDAGAPPVYVGFGSVGSPAEAAAVGRLVIEALTRCGQRGLLASGWGGVVAADLPENFYLIDAAPHDWLFPRMSAVVHHGGAGTTAAAFRAGVPSVIVPHGNDQFAWAQRAFELGVAPKPIPRKQLDVGRLATAITRTLAADVVEAARALGLRVRAENGVADAVALIEAAGSA